MNKRLVVIIILILLITIICFSNTVSADQFANIWGKVQYGPIPIKDATVEAEGSNTFKDTTNKLGIYSI